MSPGSSAPTSGGAVERPPLTQYATRTMPRITNKAPPPMAPSASGERPFARPSPAGPGRAGVMEPCGGPLLFAAVGNAEREGTGAGAALAGRGGTLKSPAPTCPTAPLGTDTEGSLYQGAAAGVGGSAGRAPAGTPEALAAVGGGAGRRAADTATAP